VLPLSISKIVVKKKPPSFKERWIEATGPFEMSVYIYQTTWHHIPKDSNL
jgi:hypothetical protein